LTSSNFFNAEIPCKLQNCYTSNQLSITAMA